MAGILPDLDGLGIVVDLINLKFFATATDYYSAAHHLWLHGLLGSLLIAGLLWLLSSRHYRVFWIALIIAHLHLVCDLLGSRGPNPQDIWPIAYWGPFWTKPEYSWMGQWRLDSWQNLVITASSLAACFYSLWRKATSPFEWVWPTGHRLLLSTLRRRFGNPEGTGSRPA